MTKLISYKNDPAFKKMFVAEVKRHRESDQIVAGQYGDSKYPERGFCSVGCAIDSLNIKLGKNYLNSDHSVIESESLYPEWLARLQDTIFEGLRGEDQLMWSERFSKAIPVGVDFAKFDMVKWKFSVFLLKENIERTLTLRDISDELKTQVVSAIRGALVVHENAIQTGEWDESAWSAWLAAAWSACSVWSAELARSAAAYIRYSKELLRLLKEVR